MNVSVERRKIGKRRTTWSERKLVRLVRKEASAYIDQRKRSILNDVGLLVLEGKVKFILDKDGVRAQVDLIDVSAFLNHHFNDGDDVKILVAQVRNNAQTFA